MSVLTINLKQLYQRRVLWLVYAVFAYFAWLLIYISSEGPEMGGGILVGPVVLELLVGLVAAVLQMDILKKAFAFCLPGHRQMVRKFIFLIAVVTNVLGSLLFLFYPHVPLGLLPLILCSAFCAGMIFYLAGVWMIFGRNRPTSFVGFVLLAIASGPMLGLPRLLEIAIVYYPVPVIVLGLLTSVAMWVHLGHAGLARRSCLRPWIGLEAFDGGRLQDLQARMRADQWGRLKDHPRPWVEDLLIGCMERQRPLSVARYLWGALYTAFSMSLSHWPAVVWFVVFFALALGYLGPRMWGIVALVPLILVSNAKPTVFSSMLAVGGRNERFYATLAVALVGSVLLAFFLGAVIAVSALLSAVMPDIQHRSFTFSYQLVTTQCFYIPLVLLPIAATLHLVLYRKPFLIMIALMSMVYGVVMSDFTDRVGAFAMFGPQIILAVGAAAWIIFVLVLRHISARCCLAQ